MLEVVNLTKIYKSKKGKDTHALDGVSLCFPEKGMVFLLGKSGSGKSTLLNVCGGLDDPTSGEIIVKGRSSKNFTQSDFDSYRNTFIGFIFQEYNILNEFTVEDNIALALELQGKSKDKAAIAALLEEVDLTGYAKRKPNTLSGGQKQRIAIARALIKSPEIIMADEPTGALDSNTGKQVFDTLKKLSKTKLVIVVSHDRDFAELYGDRIIELKDGKILSDVTKGQEEKKAISENVSVVGDSICIKNASSLSDDEFNNIKEFLKGSQGDVMIACGEKDVKSFKEVNRISDDGEREVFKQTDESTMEKKEYTPADSRFIRSKLPLRHAVKIGASSLKSKPIRLAFTIFLCFVAFTLFGLLSTMTFYDSGAMFKQTFVDSNYQYIRVGKEYQVHVDSYYNGSSEPEYSYTNTGNAYFAQADLDRYKEQFGDNVFASVSLGWTEISTQSNSQYYNSTIKDATYVTPNHPMNQLLVHGAFPTQDETGKVAISTFLAETLVQLKTFDETGSPINVDTIQQLIGKKVNINNYAYEICGIFDSGSIPEKYDSLKDSSSYNENAYKFEEYLQDGLHQCIAVSYVDLDRIDNSYNYGSGIYIGNQRLRVLFHQSDAYDDYNFGYYLKPSQSQSSVTYLPGYSSSDFTNDSCAVNAYSLYTALSQYYENKRNVAQEGFDIKYSEILNLRDTLRQMPQREDFETDDDYNNFVEFLSNELYVWLEYYSYHDDESLQANLENNFPEDTYLGADYLYGDFLQGHFAELRELRAIKEDCSDKCDVINNIRYNNGQYYDEELGDWVLYTDDEIKAEINQLIEEMDEGDKLYAYAYIVSNEDNRLTEPARFAIIGYTGLSLDSWEHNLYLTNERAGEYWDVQKASLDYYEESYTNYEADPDAEYTYIFLPYDHSSEQTEAFLNIYKNSKFDETDTRIKLVSSTVSQIEFVDSMVQELSKVFLWVGIVMAVFAALLLSNFISISISNKRREIGILRAVGARGFDVFKIFFSESFIISAICSVLSIIGSVLVCGILNKEIGEGLGVSIFVFGIQSFLVLIAVALITAICATFFPVRSAARKKPVESIRAI